MSRTVTVNLDDLNALLIAATDRALRNARIYTGAGRISADLIARVGAGLAQTGSISHDDADASIWRFASTNVPTSSSTDDDDQ